LQSNSFSVIFVREYLSEVEGKLERNFQSLYLKAQVHSFAAKALVSISIIGSNLRHNQNSATRQSTIHNMTIITGQAYSISSMSRGHLVNKRHEVSTARSDVKMQFAKRKAYAQNTCQGEKVH